jgi:hypothetical protein
VAKQRADFLIFIPTYLEVLAIFQDWQTTEDSNYFDVQAIYKVLQSSDINPVLVRITETKARNTDEEFLRRNTLEDQDYIYKRMNIADQEGLLIIRKTYLPNRKTSYDPREGDLLRRASSLRSNSR